MQVVRVHGVPTEDSARKDDVINRGVRFCICKTTKPPSAEETGSPPQFIGNVTKLHATLHASQPDRWLFSNGDESDPDKSCFVRCAMPKPEVKKSSGLLGLTTGMRLGNGSPQSSPVKTQMQTQAENVISPQRLSSTVYSVSKDNCNDEEQLFLFVELVTSFKVPQGNI